MSTIVVAQIASSSRVPSSVATIRGSLERANRRPNQDGGCAKCDAECGCACRAMRSGRYGSSSGGFGQRCFVTCIGTCLHCLKIFESSSLRSTTIDFPFIRELANDVRRSLSRFKRNLIAPTSLSEALLLARSRQSSPGSFDDRFVRQPATTHRDS